MSGPTPDQIVQALLAKGVTPAQIAEVNPEIGRRVQAGMVAPRMEAPDKIATRGAYIADYRQINKDRDTLGKFYPMTADLDRFHALNTQAGTGGWDNNIPLVKNVKEWMDPTISEMSGIASGLQGKARPVGSGSTSDFEQRLYRMGVPSPEKKGPTNDSIIAYQKGVMAEENDRLAFQEEFLRRNGSLSGSQQAWARYVGTNPYTVPGDGGRTRANAKRADWKQHFGLDPAPEAAPQPKAKPEGWSNALPKAQRSAALMFKGATAPAGAKGNPFVPTSEAEFANLPPRSWYLDEDGKAWPKGGR